VLLTGDKAAHGGGDLRDIVDTARRKGGILKGLHSRYPRFIIEQAAIAGALSPKVLKDTKQAQGAAAYIAKRLDALAEETERGWHGEALPEGGGGLGGRLTRRSPRPDCSFGGSCAP